MRCGLFIILLIAGIDAADTTGFFTPQTTLYSGQYENRGTDKSEHSRVTRTGALSGTPVYRHSALHQTGTATGRIVLSHINIVKNNRSYNLLGKETTNHRKATVKRSRKWHEQVINLFR